MTDRAGEPITGAAIAMLDLLGSVGTKTFDITLLDIKGAASGTLNERGVSTNSAAV